MNAPTATAARAARDGWAVSRQLVEEARLDDVPSLAAGVAFKIFLSLFPSLIVAVALFGAVMTPEAIDDLLAWLREFAPAGAVGTIEEPLQELVDQDEGVTTVVALGTLGALWAATSAAVTLMRALSRAYGFPETRRLLRQRVMALAITAALFIAIAALMLLLVFGPQLQRLVLPEFAETALSPLLTFGRYLSAIAVLVILFAFVYWIGPDRGADRPGWHWISHGAVVAVLGWLALSWLFSLYTRNVGGFADNPAYAGFGGIIALLLWLQLTMVVLLVGAELNVVIYRRRERRKAAGGAGFAVLTPREASAEVDGPPVEPVPAEDRPTRVSTRRRRVP